MDYKGNAELWRHQWKKIQDPERILLAFLEDEEEGEMAPERKYLAYIIDYPNNKIYYHNYLNYPDERGISELLKEKVEQEESLPDMEISGGRQDCCDRQHKIELVSFG
jgi:hypothetical protein